MQERAHSVVSSILAKYDIRNRIAPTLPSQPSPLTKRADTLGRSISTLFTRRVENGSTAPLSNSNSAAISTTAKPSVSTVTPAAPTT